MTMRESADEAAQSEAFQTSGQEILWSRAGFLVRRLHQIHVAMFLEQCAGETITPVQFGVLTVLSGGAKLDQATLGKEVGIDRTTIADVVSRLEKRGLVRRDPSEADRRVRVVSITQKGTDYFGRLVARVEAAQDRLIAPLAPAERETFLKLLRKLVEANNEHGRTVLRARVR